MSYCINCKTVVDLSANELDNADDNQVNKEAESLLKQYSDESDVRVK